MSFKLKNGKISLTIVTGIIITAFAIYYISTSYAVHVNDPYSSGQKITLKDNISYLSGDWGNIEIDPVIIQAQADYFINDTDFNAVIDTMKSSGQWKFDGLNPDKINSLFKNAGLSQETCDILMSNTKPNPNGKGFITTPPDSVLWNFTTENRSRLYPMIGRLLGNPAYSTPYHFTSKGPEEWFLNSSLPKDITDKLLTLVYVEDDMCLLSDLHLIAPLLKTPEDWSNLLQTIFRKSAVDVYLKIAPGEDITKLANYWGNLTDGKNIRPVLQEARDNPQGGRINIADLLPPIPKSRLNTYTGISETKGHSRDCIWTMVNFFNEKSDERFNQKNVKYEDFLAISKLLQNPDKSSLKFGDIILITDKDNNLIHTCVYIAGNIVYTKNGQNSNITISPFILSEFDTMYSIYSARLQDVHVYLYSRLVADTNKVRSMP